MPLVAVLDYGIGNLHSAQKALERAELDELAIECAGSGRPFLGVCIDMQMLYEGSEESPDVPGLGVLPGIVRRLPEGVKHPQMQWNVVVRRGQSGLLDGLPDPIWTYFVHSFAADSDHHAVAVCDYGGPVVAAVERDALWATQFHPEKSGSTGLAILANFVRAAAAQAEAA